MDHVPMNLVLFDDAIEHLTRVHRVIRMEKGHALLVGVGGSGKQSLTKLGAFCAGCEVFEITLTRGYDENSFREDLKGLYSKLGLENKKMVFLFTDAHVAQEGNGFVPFSCFSSCNLIYLFTLSLELTWSLFKKVFLDKLLH